MKHHDQHNIEMRTLLMQERKRLARDLHDGTAQQLAHALHKLEIISKMLEKHAPLSQVQKEIAQLTTVIKTSEQELRANMDALLPINRTHYSYPEAINLLIQEARSYQPSCIIETHLEGLHTLPEHLETPFYRLLQEALTNIRKHAQAQHVLIQSQQRGDTLWVDIQDDGVGFTTNNIQPHIHGRQLGLSAMRDRVYEVGGTFQIESRPQCGTHIKVQLPLYNRD